MHGVAQSMIDVALNEQSPPALNIVHPRPVPFDSLIAGVNDGLVNEGIVPTQIPVLPIQEWFSLLEARSKGASDDVIKQIVRPILASLAAVLIVPQPAIKLLEFFRNSSNADAALRSGQRKGSESGGMAEFSTTKSQAISSTMKDLPALGRTEAHMWIKYWKSAGLFK